MVTTVRMNSKGKNKTPDSYYLIMNPVEAVYPIVPPADCPDYVVRSVQDQCNHPLRRALGGAELAELELGLRLKLRDELETMRAAFDGRATSTAIWLKWGLRTVTRAHEDAIMLVKFREALARDDFSHVTSGHSVNPNTYHVYRRDSSSPSGCFLVASAGHDLPYVDTILAASKHRTCQGAQRGEMANRRAMGGYG